MRERDARAIARRCIATRLAELTFGRGWADAARAGRRPIGSSQRPPVVCRSRVPYCGRDMPPSFLVALCAALLVVPSASARPQGTDATFAKRADAICADYQARVSRVPRTAVSDMPGMYRLAVAVLGIARTEAAKIDALALPNRNRAFARAWVSAWDPGLLRLLVKLRDAAKRKDARGVRAIVVALDANGATGRRLARSLGMKICSRKT